MNQSSITVVLADDHQIVRDGVRMVLEAEPDIEVVAEAGTVDDAARYVLGHRPSILVLDLNMPDGPSLEAIPRILERSPETVVVVLTMQADPGFAREALRGGARGYVVKHAAARELVDAVRATLSGDTYVSPTLAGRLATHSASPEGPPDGLTKREAEVLRYIALGYMNPEIAEELVIAVRTVETHRASIRSKTGLSTRAELIAYALEHGLVER